MPGPGSSQGYLGLDFVPLTSHTITLLHGIPNLSRDLTILEVGASVWSVCGSG